ncbi:MAG: hypothetical protein N2043_01630 [Ignavibacterium sp.]|nr:hypothetical protein [Ignavibacterium sp.]
MSKKYTFCVLKISYDNVRVTASSYDEAVNKFLNGEYVYVGPDGVLDTYYDRGMSLFDLKQLGVSDETIKQIIKHNNQYGSSKENIFGGVLMIEEE